MGDYLLMNDNKIDSTNRLTLINKKDVAFLFSNMIVAVAFFSVMIANGLTNTFDGMWNGTYYVDYKWVVSIGRWLWPILGREYESFSVKTE